MPLMRKLAFSASMKAKLFDLRLVDDVGGGVLPDNNIGSRRALSVGRKRPGDAQKCNCKNQSDYLISYACLRRTAPVWRCMASAPRPESNKSPESGTGTGARIWASRISPYRTLNCDGIGASFPA